MAFSRLLQWWLLQCWQEHKLPGRWRVGVQWTPCAYGCPRGCNVRSRRALSTRDGGIRGLGLRSGLGITLITKAVCPRICGRRIRQNASQRAGVLLTHDKSFAMRNARKPRRRSDFFLGEPYDHRSDHRERPDHFTKIEKKYGNFDSFNMRNINFAALKHSSKLKLIR